MHYQTYISLFKNNKKSCFFKFEIYVQTPLMALQGPSQSYETIAPSAMLLVIYTQTNRITQLSTPAVWYGFSFHTASHVLLKTFKKYPFWLTLVRLRYFFCKTSSEGGGGCCNPSLDFLYETPDTPIFAASV